MGQDLFLYRTPPFLRTLASGGKSRVGLRVRGGPRRHSELDCNGDKEDNGDVAQLETINS